MKKLICIVVFCVTMANNALAFNTGFLSYSSAVYYFTDQDSRMMQATMNRALNTSSDNTKVSWRNPNTGAKGYAIPFNTTTKGGLKCRNLKIYDEAHQVSGVSEYQFCKIQNEWKIVN